MQDSTQDGTVSPTLEIYVAAMSVLLFIDERKLKSTEICVKQWHDVLPGFLKSVFFYSNVVLNKTNRIWAIGLYHLLCV
jgi:hypothetical protein